MRKINGDAEIENGPTGEHRYARRESPRSRAFLRARMGAAVVATLFVAACAASGGKPDGFNAFLVTIAADCKPLIIGSDDIGQAIVFNGLGAAPEHYGNFLGKTSALYDGGLSQDIYRDSLTAFLGGGSYNRRSFDCIIAHLPATKPPAARAN